MACSAAQCICAQKSTCSCGKQPALKCNCSKASVENVVPSSNDACACGKEINQVVLVVLMLFVMVPEMVKLISLT